jgi:NAD(P)-dependent dehydrogenase (short-subunit alcohol dehydrogenase family)
MKYDFSGKVALVTGAGSGIGRASAIAFAASGAKVMVSDVADTAGAETVAIISAAGGTACFFHCDVSNAALVDAMVQTTVSEFGRLDFAHNNAGINSVSADEWDETVFQRSLDINLTGVMLGIKYQAPAILANGGGAIVNTASIAGLVGNARQPAYTAGKHAVVGLTKSAALRYAREGIRVNCVCPGVIDTAMVASIASVPKLREIMESMTPMGRMGKPEEIAAAVMWLCSDHSSFVTGHALVIDGGATIQ